MGHYKSGVWDHDGTLQIGSVRSRWDVFNAVTAKYNYKKPIKYIIKYQIKYAKLFKFSKMSS